MSNRSRKTSAAPPAGAAPRLSAVERVARKPIGRQQPRKGRRTRAEQTEDTFRRLVRAGMAVIGDVGYARATVARITLHAKVAVGTFYTYFASRQEFFDRLLPLAGEDMIDYVRARSRYGRTLVERERIGFRALFDYYAENPGLYRLLNEAEMMAPKAHAEHFRNLTARYVRALKRGLDAGELPGYEERELEPLAYMLMSTRNYLMMRYGRSGRGSERMPEWVVETYMKFVTGALTGRRPGGRTAGRARMPEAVSAPPRR